MINHFRCHLLNVAPEPPDWPGAEVIDSAYTVVSLPTYLRDVRRTLFGASPDRDMLNYRAAQLVRVVHNSELRKLATASDPRITYNIYQNIYVDPRFWQPAITVSAGNVSVSGSEQTPDVTGIVLQSWRLELTDESTLAIVDRAGREYSVAIVGADQTSNSFLLPGSDRRCTLQGWSPGDNSRIEVRQRPTRSVSGLLAAIEGLATDRVSNLFGIDTKYYDHPTLRQVYQIWLHNYEPPLRLAAAVLALAISTEALR